MCLDKKYMLNHTLQKNNGLANTRKAPELLTFSFSMSRDQIKCTNQVNK